MPVAHSRSPRSVVQMAKYENYGKPYHGIYTLSGSRNLGVDSQQLQ